jgi:hypothetical protein
MILQIPDCKKSLILTQNPMEKRAKVKWSYLFIIGILWLALPAHGQNKFPKPEFKAHSHGVPAAPDAIKLIQPDGSKIDVYLKGDGAVHWH